MASDDSAKGRAAGVIYQAIVDEFAYGTFTRGDVEAQLGKQGIVLDAHDFDYAIKRLQFEGRIVPAGGPGEFILNKDSILHESRS